MGDCSQKDTIVNIPISYIRSANDKLLEREALLEITKIDSILINKIRTQVVNTEIEYDKLIQYNKRLLEDNNKLNKKLEKSKSATTIFASVSGAELVVILLFILL